MLAAMRLRIVVVLVSSVLAGVALAQGQPGVVTPSLDVAMAAGGASLRASGTWVTRLKRGVSLSISPVNAVEITCSRTSMSCWESRAELAPAAAGAVPAKAGEPQKDALHLSHQQFTVTEWNEARITARSDTRSGDLMLRIVASEKLVRLSYWDTKEGKEKPGEASGFMWELQ